MVYISGNGGRVQKLKTPVDKNGGTDPTWNFPMKFTVNEAAGLQHRLTLVIKIKAVGLFGGKTLGEVKVPVNKLLEGVTPEGKAMQFVSYEVRRKSGRSHGFLSFSYKFGEKFEEPVMAYPPSYTAARGYYQQQQQPGYTGYPPPPPPGYGGYPPPPPAVYGGYAQQPRRNNLGMGLGAGLLGGLLIGDMMSHGGGGCGGGGCGGAGCGGGGCGGGF